MTFSRSDPEELLIIHEVVEIKNIKSSAIRGSCVNFCTPQRKTSFMAFQEAMLSGLMPVQPSCGAELLMIS